MNSMDEGMFDAEPWPGIDLATVPITVERPEGFIVIGRPEPYIQYRLVGMKVLHDNLAIAQAEALDIKEQLGPPWEIKVLECRIVKAA